MPRSTHPAQLLVLLPWYVAASLAAAAFATGPFVGAFAPLARILGAFFAFAAALSAFRAWRIRQALEANASLEALARLDPKELEDVLGEVFRREGYRVEENPGLGPDGGVDLRLRRGDERAVVQCKRWQPSRKVGAPVVQQLLGAQTAEGAQRAILVTTSQFTPQAEDFALANKIELIAGEALLRRVQAVQTAAQAAPGPVAASERTPPVSAPPACPKCGQPMVERTARRGANAGQRFYGCSTYPKCAGTRALG